MNAFFVALTGIALAVFAASHLALLVVLATRRPRHRALVAAVVPPLALYWVWREKEDPAKAYRLRTLVQVWSVALAVYAFGVAVIGRDGTPPATGGSADVVPARQPLPERGQVE